MRSTFVLVIAGWVALTPGMGYTASQPSPSGNLTTSNQRQARPVAPAGDRNRQTHVRVSTGTSGHRVPQKNHAPSHPSPTKATRTKQRSRNDGHSKSASATNLSQPGPTMFGGLTKQELIHNQNQTMNTRPVRSPAVVGSSMLTSNNVRHRGPIPTVIGGPARSNARNRAALNGTHMGPRP